MSEPIATWVLLILIDSQPCLAGTYSSLKTALLVIEEYARIQKLATVDYEVHERWLDTGKVGESYRAQYVAGPEAIPDRKLH